MNQFDTWWICTWFSNLTFAPPEHLQLQCFTGEQFVHFHCNVTDPWFSFTSSNQLYDCPRATDHGTKRNLKKTSQPIKAFAVMQSSVLTLWPPAKIGDAKSSLWKSVKTDRRCTCGCGRNKQSLVKSVKTFWTNAPLQSNQWKLTFATSSDPPEQCMHWLLQLMIIVVNLATFLFRYFKPRWMFGPAACDVYNSIDVHASTVSVPFNCHQMSGFRGKLITTNTFSANLVVFALNLYKNWTGLISWSRPFRFCVRNTIQQQYFPFMSMARCNMC